MLRPTWFDHTAKRFWDGALVKMLALKMTQRQFRRIHFSFTMMHFPSERTGHHAPFRAESRIEPQPNPATGVLPVAV